MSTVEQIPLTPEQIPLTPQQERFAAEHDVIVCTKCREGRAVCLYSDQPDKTIRWIVDRRGQLLERKEFDRH